MAAMEILVSAGAGAIAGFGCNVILEAWKAKLQRDGDRVLDTVKGAANAMASGYTASNERRLACIKALWDMVLEMRGFAESIMYVYDVFPPGAYPQNECEHILATLPDMSPSVWLKEFLRIVKEDESHRPFVGEHLWQQYAVYRAFMGRASVKMLSLKAAMQIPTWDAVLAPINPQPGTVIIEGIDQSLKDALEIVLTPEELAVCTQGCKGVPRKIITAIEGNMMECINSWVLGDALAQRDMDERRKLYDTRFNPVTLSKGRAVILAAKQEAEQTTRTPIP